MSGNIMNQTYNWNVSIDQQYEATAHHVEVLKLTNTAPALGAGQTGDAFGRKLPFNCVKNHFSCNGAKE